MEPGGYTTKGWKVMKRRKERKGTGMVRVETGDGTRGKNEETWGKKGGSGRGIRGSGVACSRRNIISV